MINQKLIILRKKIRANGKFVIDSLVDNHSADICVLCGSDKELTKEHVIPKWAFENNPEKDFITNINGLSQSYSKTVVPACFDCNSYILGALENHLEVIFKQTDFSSNSFHVDVLEKIILWLEFIEYKFQALNLRRKFRKIKNKEFIPALSELPVGIIQNFSLSPAKVFSNLRNALKRLSVKSKIDRINSLIVFETTNKTFHFFHKTNEFIFIELPKHKVGFFYFFNKKFENGKQAHSDAMKLIKKVY